MVGLKIPTFSLCYTSRRPHAIVPVVNEWRTKAEDWSDVEVIITIDSDDPNGLAAANKVQGAKVIVQDRLPGNCVKGWNLAAYHSTGQVLIAISDDFDPPNGWDSGLKSLDPKDWMFSPRVVLVNDSYIQDLCTLPIVTRAWYSRFGYLFYPAYESIYCDTELTYQAKKDKCLLRAMHLVFVHCHPDNQMRHRDKVDLAHSSKERYRSGKAIFDARKKKHFPRLPEGPRQKTSATNHDQTHTQ